MLLSLSLSTLSQLSLSLSSHLYLYATELENIGVQVDVDLLKQYRQALKEHLAALKRETRNIVGEEIDLSSATKVADLLFNRLKMRPPIER